MNHRVVLGAGVVIACAAGLFIACGGSSADTATSTGDGGGANEDGGSPANGTDGQAANGNDAGGTNTTEGGGPKPGTDGGGPGPAIDGGTASDPGFVSCGDGKPKCDTTTSFCCTQTFFDGGSNDTCEKDNGPTCAGQSNHCNEAADCTASVCCLAFGGKAGSGATCETSCKGGYQICRTETECGDAGCNKLTCAGQSLEVCGKPIGCK